MDLNVLPAWIQGYTGKGVVVSIVDDGVLYIHSWPCLMHSYCRSQTEAIIMSLYHHAGLQRTHPDLNANFVSNELML